MALTNWLKHKVRAWVLGNAEANQFEGAWGHDVSDFVAPEYGDYITTSSIIYSVVTLRANLLAELPLRLYTGTDEDKTVVPMGAIADLFRKVNPHWTTRRLIKMTSMSLDLWGQCFWFCERGDSGMRPPSEIWWARPDHVAVVVDPADYIKEYLYYPGGTMSGQPVHFQPYEVVWFRNPNPVDQFAPLSPMAAARLAADLHSGAMKSNERLFRQGLQIGGFIMPPAGATWTPEQTRQAEEEVTKRHSGVDKAHRWAFFRQQYTINQSGIAPKDAEFLGTLNYTIEEVARVYSIPLDLLGGQRTYANVEASERGVYQRAILPMAGDITEEINEQFIPMFGEASSKFYCEFDASTVASLQEEESAAWQRYQGQLAEGAITINEWRQKQGFDPVSWGDLPKWVQTQGFVSDEIENEPADDEEDAQETEQPEPEAQRSMTREVRTPFGGDRHREIWQRFDTRSKKHEAAIAKVTVELFKAQRDAVLSGLKRAARSADDPFNKAEWKRKFREAIRPVLRLIVAEVGQQALDDLGLQVVFSLTNPAVRRFIERRAQRFAEEINNTTWEGLKKAMGAALEEGKGLLEQMKVVEEYMAGRIKSSPETIARTESMGAFNGGELEAWKQSGVVLGKEWIATLDDRVRDAHAEAHGQTVGIDEDFIVGGESINHPGGDGSAENVINCRCTISAVIDEEK